jgi:DNA-binding IscR family transcriptional regulator
LLSRPASEISAYDVVLALEGVVIDVPKQPGSAVAEMWTDVAGVVTERLKEFTVADLLDRQRELDAQSVPVYYI